MRHLQLYGLMYLGLQKNPEFISSQPKQADSTAFDGATATRLMVNLSLLRMSAQVCSILQCTGLAETLEVSIEVCIVVFSSLEIAAHA